MKTSLYERFWRWLLLTVPAPLAFAGLLAAQGGGAPPPGKAECKPERVLVKGGSFRFGAAAGSSRFGDEMPEVSVTVGDFLISRYETTVAEFQALADRIGDAAEAGGDPGAEDAAEGCFPAADVSWFAADSYCSLVGGRLPTEVEWEYAAAADFPRGGEKLPWTTGQRLPPYYDEEALLEEGDYDDEEDIPKFNYLHSTLLPVQQALLGRNGLYGMASNVWEWTDSWYVRGTVEAASAKGGKKFWKVARGGSFQNVRFGQLELLRPTARNPVAPSGRFGHLGFRCAWDP